MIYILEELMHFFLERNQHHDHEDDDKKDTTNTTIRHGEGDQPNETAGKISSQLLGG